MQANLRRYLVPRSITLPRVPVCGCACSKILQEHRSFLSTLLALFSPPPPFLNPFLRVVTYFFIRCLFIVFEWLALGGTICLQLSYFDDIYFCNSPIMLPEIHSYDSCKRKCRESRILIFLKFKKSTRYIILKNIL